MRTWQPIRTAPYGERVLVFVPESDDYMIYGSFAAILIRLTGRWLLAGGGPIVASLPTHWMPLPAPPRPEGQ